MLFYSLLVLWYWLQFAVKRETQSLFSSISVLKIFLDLALLEVLSSPPTPPVNSSGNSCSTNQTVRLVNKPFTLFQIQSHLHNLLQRITNPNISCNIFRLRTFNQVLILWWYDNPICYAQNCCWGVQRPFFLNGKRTNIVTEIKPQLVYE